jgi:hypothetical protein
LEVKQSRAALVVDVHFWPEPTFGLIRIEDRFWPVAGVVMIVGDVYSRGSN